MFGSTIVDVAIGLIFFYFLFSVITSHVNEFIATRMQWRAKDLENQIRHMLGDPELANKVLQNPMITSITSKSGKPSYIPPNTFALAVFDAFVPEGQNANVFDHVRAGVANNVPKNQASQAVLSIIDRADGNLTTARAGVEDWFNASMDRLSGEYKRRIQAVTIVVSLVLTAGVGADTIAIANSLYQEPALRAAVTGAAQGAPSNPAIQSTQGNSTGSTSSLQQSVDLLSKSQLPLGWSALPTDPIGWLKKIVGLLITTIAVSLGAPFWFDLLQNLASLRSSGPVPATTSTIPPPAPAPAAVAVSAAAAAPVAPAQAKYPGGI